MRTEGKTCLVCLNFMHFVQGAQRCRVLSAEKYSAVWELLSAFMHVLSQEEVLDCSAFI
jgi:hypothetical protein